MILHMLILMKLEKNPAKHFLRKTVCRGHTTEMWYLLPLLSMFLRFCYHLSATTSTCTNDITNGLLSIDFTYWIIYIYKKN